MDELATASEPWDNGNGRGRGHDPAIVPEPASWGLIVTAFALCLFVYARYIRPLNRCKCDRH